MKKAISLLLSLVMLFSITAGLDFSAFAATYYETEDNGLYGSANPIPLNSTIYGVCANNYDSDWYKFTLTFSAKVNIKFFSDDYNSGPWDVTIYRYDSKGNSFVLDRCNSSTYTFPTLGLSEGTYSILVYSHNSNAWGKEYGITVNCSIPTPSTLKVTTRNTTSLKLSWSKVSGASGYQLQQKSGDTYKTKKTTTSTSYTVSNLSAGKNYSFRVRAYKTVDGKKYYSGWKYLTTCAKPKTASLSKLTAYKSGHKIKATWKKVGGTASGYQIYWAKDKSFKKVVAKTTVSGQSKTSYTGKNFTKGKKYYVKIRAYKTVNGTKYYGAWSNVKSITAK
ncbi:MAG: fibronectin type III domain-containing protein [Eubacterium sp.]